MKKLINNSFQDAWAVVGKNKGFRVLFQHRWQAKQWINGWGKYKKNYSIVKVVMTIEDTNINISTINSKKLWLKYGKDKRYISYNFIIK